MTAFLLQKHLIAELKAVALVCEQECLGSLSAYLLRIASKITWAPLHAACLACKQVLHWLHRLCLSETRPQRCILLRCI